MAGNWGARADDPLSMRHTRPARCARTLFAAALASVQALVFHLAAGGELRSWPALGLSVLVGLGVGRLLTARSRHPLAWVAALAAGQVAVHAMFTVATHVGPGSGGHQHSVWDALHGHACVLYGGGSWLLVLDGRWMLAAHLASMVLSGLVLARQDTLLDGLAAALRFVVVTLGGAGTAGPVLRVPAGRPGPVDDVAGLPVARGFGTARSLRGPPVGALCS